jgi:hypothetical protein
MRTFTVSDEMYEQLKGFVIDPFDDTPEAVIGRLIEIVNKAKDRWSPFAVYENEKRVEPPAKPRPAAQEEQEDEPVVVL